MPRTEMEAYMKFCRAPAVNRTQIVILLTCLFLAVNCELFAGSSSSPAQPATSTATKSLEPGSTHLIQPEELAKVLKSASGPKPLIVQVGFRAFYQQAHIPESKYLGPASNADGARQLRNYFQHLSRSRWIVLYCGCCPWSKCPNIAPAYKALHAMGFTNVQALYIAQNFGADWVKKGYPTVRGE